LLEDHELKSIIEEDDELEGDFGFEQKVVQQKSELILKAILTLIIFSGN